MAKVSPLKINGEMLPPPKRSLKFVVSSSVNSGRNANAEMVGERVGRDSYKADSLVWPWLTAKQWAHIQTLMKDFFFTCSMPDQLNAGKWVTHKCYCGDRSAEPYWLDKSSGLPTHYLNCCVNIIDCGIIGD